jgi:hypothetical protein
VSEKFSVDWGTYMSSHNDVVYVKLDVRGARGLGSKSLYRHLGGVEVQDQITVLRSATSLFSNPYPGEGEAFIPSTHRYYCRCFFYYLLLLKLLHVSVVRPSSRRNIFARLLLD